MTLSAALAQAKVTRKGPRCTMCALLDRLDTRDRDALTAALNDAGYSSSAISRALKAEGHAIGSHTVNRHRSGGCAG